MTIPFSHLHVHTDASLKDGLGTVDNLVNAAAEFGFKHLAMTDHGTLANAIAFTAAAELAGVKPIMGVEAYVSVDDQIGHMTFLASGRKGFDNLVELQNLGHASAFKQPAITIPQILAYSDGLICLTGCVSSPFNKLPFDYAVRLGAQLKSAFGNRLFAEVMFISDTDTWTRPMQLSKALGIKAVITNDAHFPRMEDRDLHPLLTSMKAGYTYNSLNLYLKSGEEVLAMAQKAGVDETWARDAIQRAFNIGELIEPIDFRRTPKLPHIPDAVAKLNAIVEDSLTASGADAEHRERARFELDVINRMGYATYFLILHDIIRDARVHNVRVGPGRGSGAGSYVLYLLNITEVDPLTYGLSFERFLNPERVGMPDVDTDFDSEHRDHVIEYAKKKWGAIPIMTYSRFSHKSLIHDLAKMFHISREEEEAVADGGETCKEFKEVIARVDGFEKAYHTFLGQIRHRGTHAGGVIITDQAVPIERSTDSLAAAWTEGLHNELSTAGIVKFDLLGLSALSVLLRLEKHFAKRAEKPKDGDDVFSVFKKGELEGIFQFSGSAGIKGLTVKLAPEKFEDLVAINALYRPGALDVGSTEKFPEWKKHPRETHPIIADILAPTYGAIVYQEQVMAIFARITGGTLGSADEARRVIVKSKEKDVAWIEKMEKLRHAFVSGGIKHGMSEDDAQSLWMELAAHSRYSFNKAHAVAYAEIAWETAWWKHHHPAYFFTEMLNVDKTEAQTYLVAAILAGLSIKEPHINTSGVEYVCDEDAIYLPLTAIKFLSDTAAEAILAARSKIGAFSSLKEFMEKVPKKLVRGQARAGLYELGAFEGIAGEAKDLELKADDGFADMKSRTEIQRERLGLVIPDAAKLRRVMKAISSGFRAGIITEVEDKTSKWGPYHVFKLAPGGSFWTRGLTLAKTLRIGDAVAADVNTATGKARRIKILE